MKFILHFQIIETGKPILIDNVNLWHRSSYNDRRTLTYNIWNRNTISVESHALNYYLMIFKDYLVDLELKSIYELRCI